MLLTNVFCSLLVCCSVAIDCGSGGAGETSGGSSSVAMPATDVQHDAAAEGGVVVSVAVRDVALRLEVMLVGLLVVTVTVVVFVLLVRVVVGVLDVVVRIVVILFGLLFLLLLFWWLLLLLLVVVQWLLLQLCCCSGS